MPQSTRYLLLLGISLAIPILMVGVWLRAAAAEMNTAPAAAEDVAVASASEDTYCTPQLKRVLRRVASACGLVQGSSRGCKPGDARSVAALSGADFNALFKPLAHRARIIQFDSEQVDLDDGARRSVEEIWSDQRGASFFFVVSRASPDGDAAFNQRLSQKRAQSVLGHLEQTFNDPELKQEVGLMWLGEEFAQLPDEFCSWSRSREGACSRTDINRSAFVTWIDCAI